jgi:antitoxin VapB
MTAKAKTTLEQTKAKLFWIGHSQAVRLPKAFRIEGDRVSIRRFGAGVLLEPILETPKESVEQWFARMDAMKGDPILPNGRNQRLAPIREYFE